MFTGTVLLGDPYTLKMNEHVRVDLSTAWRRTAPVSGSTSADLYHPHLFHVAEVRSSHTNAAGSRITRIAALAGRADPADRFCPDGLPGPGGEGGTRANCGIQAPSRKVSIDASRKIQIKLGRK